MRGLYVLLIFGYRPFRRESLHDDMQVHFSLEVRLVQE